MPDTYLTRKTLLKRLRSETDQMAWEEFVQFYGGFIRSIIINMRINDSDQEDLLQTVLLKIWKSLDQFNHNQQKGHFRSWISAITKNTVLTHISKQKRLENKKIAVENNPPKEFDEPEIDDIIDAQWEKHISTLAYKNISGKVSEVAMNAFLAGLRNEKAEETAEKLDVSVDMVYTYRSRVKMKLVAEIKNLREMLE